VRHEGFRSDDPAGVRIWAPAIGHQNGTACPTSDMDRATGQGIEACRVWLNWIFIPARATPTMRLIGIGWKRSIETPSKRCDALKRSGSNTSFSRMAGQRLASAKRPPGLKSARRCEAKTQRRSLFAASASSTTAFSSRRSGRCPFPIEFGSCVDVGRASSFSSPRRALSSSPSLKAGLARGRSSSPHSASAARAALVLQREFAGWSGFALGCCSHSTTARDRLKALGLNRAETREVTTRPPRGPTR